MLMSSLPQNFLPYLALIYAMFKNRLDAISDLRPSVNYLLSYVRV